MNGVAENSMTLREYMDTARKMTLQEYLDITNGVLKKRCLDSERWYDNPLFEKRFEREMKSIQTQQLEFYYLQMHELGVRVETDRHLVAFLLGLTDEFFIELSIPQQGDMPDIDVDFEFQEPVVEYLKKTYGEDKVARINNYNEYKVKSLIRDVAKVSETYIPKKVQEDIEDIDSVLAYIEQHEEAGDFETVVESDTDREALRRAARMEGNVRQYGTTAAGVIVSSEPIQKYSAIYKGKEKNGKDTYLSVYDKVDCEAIGFLKMDVLRVITIEVMHKAIDLVKEWHPDDHDIPENLWDIPLEGPMAEKMIRQFRDGKTDLIFQYGGGGLKPFMEPLRPETVGDLVAANALVRPGADDKEYIARKNGEHPVTYPHPAAEPILEETYGVIVYQEQIMKICKHVAGMYDRDVQRVRKMTAKKDAKYAKKLGALFIRGCIRNGLTEQEGITLWEEIAKSTNYAFNKAHAVAYFLVAWANMWFQVKYKEEWVLANLMVKDEDKNMFKVAQIGRDMDVEFAELDVNVCQAEWSRDENNVLIPGFSVLPKVGMTSAKKIVAERDKNGPFESLEDMRERMPARNFNKTVQEKLAMAGALPEGREDERFNITFHKVYNFKAVNVLKDEGIVDVHDFWNLKEVSELGDKPTIIHGYVRTCLKPQATKRKHEQEVYIHGDDMTMVYYHKKIDPGPYIFLVDSSRYRYCFRAIPIDMIDKYPILPERIPDGYDVLGERWDNGICWIGNCRKVNSRSYVTGALVPHLRILWLDHSVEPGLYHVEMVRGGKNGKSRWKTTPIKKIREMVRKKKGLS